MTDRTEILSELGITAEAVESGRIGVHDALQAWQHGLIDTTRAMELTGLESIEEMLQCCRSSDVEIRRGT